jgi:ribonuclease HII
MALYGGLDEVGYGSWAGYLLSVVAVFREQDFLQLPKGVTDSKKVSEKERAGLYGPIIDTAFDLGFGHAWPWEIDDFGVFAALQLSYERALDDLTHKPDVLIVDGSNRVSTWRGKQIVEPKADRNWRQVSAASIVAKVTRDRDMVSLSRAYPAYGWDQNKGYGSAHHENAIHQHGLIMGSKSSRTYIHRRRYVQKVMLRGA